MTRKHTLPAVAAIALLSAGCYHATVDTGVTPTAETHEIWAHSWIYGLVPPSEVDARTRCDGARAAKVETKISFLNGLVGALTFSIYTPMTIEITCGAE